LNPRLKEKHGYKIAPTTLENWMAENRELITYRRLRGNEPLRLKPLQTIRSIKLYHRQVYSFAYHRQKLALMRQDPRHRRFAALADFLEQAPSTCPHSLFQDSSRASQLAEFVDRNHLIVVEKENYATRTAGLVIPTVGDNRLRHETLQRFMLANDSVTVATEIPIWLERADIEALEIEHGIRLRPDGDNAAVLTGHIDFIQIRNGAVHILDYKPDARTNKPIAQLTLYALALTRLAGLRLFDIKCAWFNEEQYCEFFPRALLADQLGKVQNSSSPQSFHTYPRP
jgi:ATP-dependent exoDNAse (exonuclease V) beta subunit